MRLCIASWFSLIALGIAATPAGAQQESAPGPILDLAYPLPPTPEQRPKLYNTAKQKLLEGKQVFSFTQSRFDTTEYCEKAKHYDYTWFEMQHSTLTFRDVETMIAACPAAPAIPMIRLPDAQEHHIQKATDLGALGVVIPTVDDASRAIEAAKWSRFPPFGRRSSGGGQAGRLWSKFGNYRQTFNDNMLVVVMIESPTGVANAFEIASVPGIDVVIIGNNDLSSFSGFAQNDPRYQAMIKKVHDETLRAGKIFGQASARYAQGHPLSKNARFFQNGPSNDGWQPPASGRGGRRIDPNAPPEGEEETPAGRGTPRPGRGTQKK
jgi:4-hydroxy-2-oxoheptanedioate aldolase